MPVIIPPGFAMVTQPYFNNDAAEENAVTYGVSLAGWTGTQVAIANELQAEHIARWQSQTDDGFQLLPTRVQIGNDGPPIVVVATGNIVNGTRAGAAISPQVAVILTKRTSFGGRQFRGRVYLPGTLLQTDVDQGGRLAAARRTALQTVADLWFSHMETGAWSAGAGEPLPMVLLHSPPKSGLPAPAPTAVNSLEIQPVVGTQRGRLPR